MNMKGSKFLATQGFPCPGWSGVMLGRLGVVAGRFMVDRGDEHKEKLNSSYCR
jgi:hypothetical protein